MWYVLSRGGKKLTDAQITAIFNAYPGTAIGTEYGPCAKSEHIKADGTYQETSEYLRPSGDGKQGTYQNGGSWLAIDAFMYLSAQWG